MDNELITVALAAKEKGCTPQAIYQLLNRGAITEYRLGTTRLVVKDAIYHEYRVKETGGRRHRRYVENQPARRSE